MISWVQLYRSLLPKVTFWPFHFRPNIITLLFMWLTFLSVTFELKKIEQNAIHHRTPNVETHLNICIWTWKGQFETSTIGQVKWPDLMNDPSRSCCIGCCCLLLLSCCCMPTMLHDKTNTNNDTLSSPMALTIFCEGLLTLTFPWVTMTSYMMTSYDLYGGHWLAVRLIHCRIAFESPRITM